MIAALFVAKNGTYFNLPGVDPWDESRDARKYNGPWPVVAHPECSRWCQLAYINQKRYGHKVGDDGGMFEFALDTLLAEMKPGDSIVLPTSKALRFQQTVWHHRKDLSVRTRKLDNETHRVWIFKKEPAHD